MKANSDPAHRPGNEKDRSNKISANASAEPGLATTTTVKDPVCGMDVDPTDSAGVSTFQVKTFHFCSAHCLEEFNKDPRQYLEGSEKSKQASPTSSEAIYTDRVSQRSGSLSFSGSALVFAFDG